MINVTKLTINNRRYLSPYSGNFRIKPKKWPGNPGHFFSYMGLSSSPGSSSSPESSSSRTFCGSNWTHSRSTCPSSVSTERAATMGACSSRPRSLRYSRWMGWLSAPAPVTAFHQRRAVERPQAGQQGQRQARPFAETQRPAILDGFEYGGWTFDNGNFVIHEVTCMVSMIPYCTASGKYPNAADRY